MQMKCNEIFWERSNICFYHMLLLRYLATKIFYHCRDKIAMKVNQNVSGQGQGVQPQAPAPQVGAAQPAPILPAFALGPGRGNALLDYSNTSHIKTYYKAVTPLENKFDGKPSSL